MVDMYNNVLNETKSCICMGDFNIDMSKQNPITEHIWDIYDVTNVIDGPTCFKAASGTLLYHLLVTSKYRVLTHINVTCGFSVWHNMVGYVARLHMPRQMPHKITYITYKKFDNRVSKQEIQQILFHVCGIFDDIDDQTWAYHKLVCNVLNEHGPIKTKIIKKNQVSECF